MNIKWFDLRDKEGTASFYSNYMTLNTIALLPFEKAYRVKVGVNAEKELVIEPISKERALVGDIEESTLLPIQLKKSYARICSSALLHSIAVSFDLDLSSSPFKFPARWNAKENVLIISIKGKGGK